jgi:uncharacterized membrane protein YphA (DoxX/SURF4 family)
MGTGERNIRQRTRTAATAAARIVVFAVLGYAGLMKLNQPQPTAEFLDSLIQVHSVGLVRTIGVGELALALLVISGAASLWAGRAVVVLFTAFAVTHAVAGSLPEPPPPCGCLGNAELAASIPAWAWIVGNAAIALMGGLIAASVCPRSAHETTSAPSQDNAAEPCHA